MRKIILLALSVSFAFALNASKDENEALYKNLHTRQIQIDKDKALSDDMDGCLDDMNGTACFYVGRELEKRGDELGIVRAFYQTGCELGDLFSCQKACTLSGSGKYCQIKDKIIKKKYNL
ncbi:MAG: hypothetical protein LBB59_03360 [Campylobacteraceae bacterium]|jgi:hypothetical protein|nr:hypothetical protein [Campylobacteraceae bacterium]